MRRAIRFLHSKRASRKLQVENVAVPQSNAAKYEAPAFSYRELDHDSNQIRLLRIMPPIANSQETRRENSREVHCQLFSANLDDHPSYKALSYTWGDESDPRHTIYINGCHFEVRENLWHALNRFQSDKATFLIWIDAICINQRSNNERNHQVNKMKMIYEQATQVIVWLGTSYNDSDLAFQLVQELYEHHESTEWITERFSKPGMLQMLRALANLFGRQYWRRIWVVQELTVAVDIMFYCGDCSMSGEYLYIAEQLFAKMQHLNGFSHDLLFDIAHHETWILDNILIHGITQLYKWKQDLRTMSLSFYECLLYHDLKEASDPRDMIYGLAAVANQTSPYTFEVDYCLSIRAAYIKFTKLEIQGSQKLNIIARMSQGPNVHHLPSWVPDWSWKPNSAMNHAFLYVIDPECRFYSASQTKAEVYFDQDVIVFKGVIIGTIDILGAPTNMLGMEDAENGISAIYNWWEIVARVDWALQNLHEAFALSLILNRILPRHYAGTSKSEFLSELLGCYAQKFKDANLELNNHLVLSKYLSAFNKCDYKTILYEWVRISLENIWDRLFFISNTETMGFAPQNAIEGDIICVPLGCDHPIILRKVEDHYINLGEAYVDGYMYGKAIDMLEAGKLELQEFCVW